MTPPPHSVFGLEFGFWGGKPRGTRKTGPGDRIRGPDPGPGARGARDPENRVFGPKIGPKPGPGPGPGTRFWDRFWTGFGTGFGPVWDRKSGPKRVEKRVPNGSEKSPGTDPTSNGKSPKIPILWNFPIWWSPGSLPNRTKKTTFFVPSPQDRFFQRPSMGAGMPCGHILTGLGSNTRR